MIANKIKAKDMTKHISCHCKRKFNSTTCNWNQKWKNKTCQCECKNYRTCKKDYSWNHSTCICQNDKCLKSIAATTRVMKLYLLWISYQQKWQIIWQQMCQ